MLVTVLYYVLLFVTAVGLSTYTPDPQPFVCHGDGGAVYIMCHGLQCRCPDIYLIEPYTKEKTE